MSEMRHAILDAALAVMHERLSETPISFTHHASMEDARGSRHKCYKALIAGGDKVFLGAGKTYQAGVDVKIVAPNGDMVAGLFLDAREFKVSVGDSSMLEAAPRSHTELVTMLEHLADAAIRADGDTFEFDAKASVLSPSIN